MPRVQAKLLVPADRRLREGDWRPRGYPYPGRVEPSMAMVGLEEQTALVLGLGAVGLRVSRACAALGMRVVGVRRCDPTTPSPSHLCTSPLCTARACAARALSLHTPCGVAPSMHTPRAHASHAHAHPRTAAPGGEQLEGGLEVYPPSELHRLLPRAAALLVCVPRLQPYAVGAATLCNRGCRPT